MLDGRHDPAFARLFEGAEPAEAPRLRRVLAAILLLAASLCASAAIAVLTGGS